MVHQSTFLSFLTASPAGQSRCCLTPVGLPALLKTPVCYQQGQSQPGLHLPRPLSTRASGLLPTSGSTQLNSACREAALPPPCISVELSSSVLLGSPEQQQASESKLASHICPELSNRKWYFTFFFFFSSITPLADTQGITYSSPAQVTRMVTACSAKTEQKWEAARTGTERFVTFFFFFFKWCSNHVVRSRYLHTARGLRDERRNSFWVGGEVEGGLEKWNNTIRRLPEN